MVVPSFRVLGCRVDAIGRDAAVACIAALANPLTSSAAADNTSGQAYAGPGLVVTLGVEMVMAAQRDTAFRNAIDNAALVTCDSIGLLLASKLQAGPLQARVTGVELVDALAARSASAGDVRLYLLGGADDTAAFAAIALRDHHPGAVISGARDGYFQPDESDAVAAAIRASGANVLLAGLGFPKQELWIERYLGATGCGAGIGVGGSLDVYAGNVVRAPVFFRRTGLEWAYRLAKEPRRWRRQLALPRFALAVARDALTRRESGNKPS